MLSASRCQIHTSSVFDTNENSILALVISFSLGPAFAREWRQFRLWDEKGAEYSWDQNDRLLQGQYQRDIDTSTRSHQLQFWPYALQWREMDPGWKPKIRVVHSTSVTEKEDWSRGGIQWRGCTLRPSSFSAKNDGKKRRYEQSWVHPIEKVCLRAPWFEKKSDG